MKAKFLKFILSTVVFGSALVGCTPDDTPVTCTNHTWDAGTITKEATANEDGIKTYTCTICKTTKTEVVPKDNGCDHKWNAGEVTTAPTTEKEGVKTYTCSECGATKTESIDKITEGQKYRVTYDANGGSGTAIVDMQEYEPGTRATVKANTFTAPEGKEFIVWNEEADGSGASYRPNGTIKMLEDVTLYAQWDDIEVPPVIDDEDAEHNIKVVASSGISYTLSENKAKKDTEITLTLSVGDNVTLNGNPTSQQVALTKVSDLVYKFTMPSVAVTINVRGTIDGDVVLSGDISAKLEDADGDGIYSKELALNEKVSYAFSYVVKNASGEPTRLSSMKLDETKCDANVTFTSGDNELLIAGGATYTFYYDSNKADYNCYITRKTIDVLPTNSKTVYNLFDGKLRSQSTIHPQSLTGIHYTKVVDGNEATLGYKALNEDYTYKKISDTESFAVSIDKNNGDKKSYVYKNIDTANDVYSVVNTYTKTKGADGCIVGNNEADDNVWNLDPYGDMQGNRNFAYSARQDIVANDMYRDTSRYQITEREAYRNVSMAAHYGDVLEYEIYKSIRGDFDGTAVINAANPEGSKIKVTSVPAGGGFRTNVESQLEYNHEESGSTADVTQQYAFVYNVAMVFKTNGDLFSLNYSEKYYTKDNWDFVNHAPKSGASAVTTTITVNNEFDKTYDRATVLGDFNPSDYFISSIDKLSFYDDSTGMDKETNTSVMNFDSSLDIYEYLGGGKTSKLVDEFKFSPATALDAWQYGCVSSTDAGVVGDTPWGMKTIGVGTATAKFANHLENMNGPTKDVSITVYAGGTFHSLYVNGLQRDYDSFDTPHADYMYGYAGKTMKFYIDSSSNSGCPVSYYMVFKVKNEFGDISYATSSPYFNVVNGVGTVHNNTTGKDHTKIVGHDLILDFNTDAANALKSAVTVDITFMSEYYTDGFGPSTLHVVVGPAQQPIANSTFKATYYYVGTDGKTLTDKKFEDATIEFASGGTGSVKETLYTETGDIKCQNVYNFVYTESNNGTISASITSVNIGESGMPATASSYSLHMERQKDGSIGVCLYTDDLDIFGQCDTDEEGYTIVETLDVFERVGA